MTHHRYRISRAASSTKASAGGKKTNSSRKTPARIAIWKIARCRGVIIECDAAGFLGNAGEPSVKRAQLAALAAEDCLLLRIRRQAVSGRSNSAPFPI